MASERSARAASRLVAAAVVAVVATGAATWLVVPRRPAGDGSPPPARIEVAGARLALEGDPVADALDLVRRYARGELRLALSDGRAPSLRPAELGLEIDRVRLAALVRAALDPESALGRAHQSARSRNPEAVLRIPVPIRVDEARAVAALLSIKDAVDRAPVDAAVDLEARKLRPEAAGLRLDVYGTLARIEAALRSGASEAQAAVEELAPRVRAAELGDVAFDEILGWFETRYNRGGKYKDRTFNLRLAASKLDGTVLTPGATFDFNATVGPRDEAHGYRVAPVIAQGELVDGIGGGTCQISGTLHAAAFFAGLDILERVPHSRPSSYIKLGLDAAVAYPAINLRLRNPFDRPVVLHQTVRDGVVRAEILGPRRTRTVTFFRRIDEVVAFDEVERETDDLGRGARVLAQRGVPGLKTTVVRLVREGAYAVRTERVDTYPPTTQVVLVGRGPEALAARRADDGTPEYVADEQLSLTQGPDVRAGGGSLETRLPGRTGERGWQERAGMKVWRAEEDAEVEPDRAADEPRGARPGAGGEGSADAGRTRKRKKAKSSEGRVH
jgi:vancomycin resistance protein YoaR